MHIFIYLNAKKQNLNYERNKKTTLPDNLEILTINNLI